MFSTNLIFPLHGSVDLYGISIMFMSVLLKEDSYEDCSSFLYPTSWAEQQRRQVPRANQGTSSLTSRMSRAMLPSFHANTHLSSLMKTCGRWLTWVLKLEWVHGQILSRPVLGKLQISESFHCMVRGKNCTTK